MPATARTLHVWLVCYDVADARRLRRVARLLEGYGRRLQRSVFLCRLDTAQRARLRDELTDLLAPDADTALLVPLCAGCAARIEQIGLPVPLHLDQTCLIL